MRDEYDFSKAVRGKHFAAYRAGTNVAFLEPDVAAAFPDSASVNEALRLLVRLSKTKSVVRGPKNPTLEPTGAGKTGAQSSRHRTAQG